MKELDNNFYWTSAKGSYWRTGINPHPTKIVQLLSLEEDEALGMCPAHIVSEPPVPLTPLVGREQEIGAVCALLLQPSVRLLTLAGPGGVGKTRLALQIAAEVKSAFEDGICFVSLASVSTIDQVLPAIARALGLTGEQRVTDQQRTGDQHVEGDQHIGDQRREGGQRAYKSRPYASRHDVWMQMVLRDRHFLLVLDNFEQVANAAPLLKKLLAACPHVKMLVTSRAILRLLEEHVFYVAPLALPERSSLLSCEELAQVDAVSLFLQRVHTKRPDFKITSENAHAIAQICTRLDGLPLALEQAAARMELFSPQSLLERLDHRLSFLTSGPCDAPERQQTLRKTIEWSYDLLTPEEQRLFRRLSVFVGGCSLHAIEAINDAMDERDESLLNTLASLLNQSVLQRETQIDSEEYRFTMLDTIREFALECLQKSDEEEAIYQAHAEYYLAQARTIEFKIAEGEAPRWIESDFENLRTAFDWFLTSREKERTLEMSIIETGSPRSLAVCLVVMGTILALQKRYTCAVRLWGKAKDLYKARSTELEPYEWLSTILGTHLFYSQVLETVHTQLGNQGFAAAWNEGRSMELEHLLAGSESPMISISSPPAKVVVSYSHGLTSREGDVLRLLTQGLSSALIAEQLFISLTTVNSHIRTIYNKLGVSSRSAATRYALEHHLV